MRTDQYVGLNPWATRKVSKTMWVREVGVRILPGGRRQPFNRKLPVPVARKEVIGQIEGAFTDIVANLYRHTMPNGKAYDEFVQATPWSSGPCYFLALKDSDGNVVPESLWSEDELAQA